MGLIPYFRSFVFTFSICSILIVLYWDYSNRVVLEMRLSDIVAENIDAYIEKSSLVGIQKVLNTVQSTNDNSTVCVQFDSNEVIQIGDRDCNFELFPNRWTSLKKNRYKVAISLNRNLLSTYYLIFGIIALSAISWLFIFYSKRTGFMLIEDLNSLLSNERETNPQFFKEFFQIKQKISKQEADLVASKSNAAIAQTTQMLAHDVRKPFSMLKSGLSLIKNADSSRKNEIVGLVEGQVNTAIRDVSEMITDIMEIGNTSDLRLIPTSISKIAESTLIQVAHIFPERKVYLSFDIKEEFILGEPRKLKRVFSNIISNAIQASEDDSVNIWIKSEKTDSGKVRLILGNSGSFIPEADREKLFESFYTKGKKDGTGLGLAIVKKIIESHGGEISIESRQVPMMCEFVIDLDSCQEDKSVLIPALGDKLADYITKPEDEFLEADRSLGQDPREGEYLDKIEAYVGARNKKIVIGLLDDEKIYRSAIRSLIETTKIARYVRFLEYSTSSDILSSTLHELDFLISDVDLGEPRNGYDVVREIKAWGYAIPICIHSNKNLPEFYRMSEEVGATAFMPKPMSPAHLLGFIANNLQEDKPQEQALETQASGCKETATLSESKKEKTDRPTVLVLDDEDIYLKAWELTLSCEANVRTYSDTSFMVEEVLLGTLDLSKVDIVICDYYFKNDDVMTNKVGDFLRKKGFSGKLYLSSNGIEKDLPEGFDKRISKEAQPYSSLAV